MFASILTAFCFALSGVTGQKVAVRLGSQWGNLLRLALAAVILGVLTFFFFPRSLHQTVFAWFFLSGLVGFGLGDTLLFAAYQRLGSRLTILLTFCLAPVFAIILEGIWLGNSPTWRALICIAMTLTGVGLALIRSPGSPTHSERKGSFGIGVVAAIFAGVGQGCGAVISRKAEQVAGGLGVVVPGIPAAFQRILAGVLVAGIVVFVLRFLVKTPFSIPGWSSHRKVSGWMVGAALFGPVIGVSCFQWALRTQESGVVLAVVALTPIIMMPMVAITEKDRPGIRSILGALLAVTGIVLLYIWGLQ